MWPFKKDLESTLNKTKVYKVCGIKFKLRKIDTTDYADGSKILLNMYQTYDDKKPSTLSSDKAIKKLKTHYKDIFLASVVEPKLKRKDEGEGILVDNLFTDWTLAHGLYGSIIEFNTGKKKLKPRV